MGRTPAGSRPSVPAPPFASSGGPPAHLACGPDRYCSGALCRPPTTKRTGSCLWRHSWVRSAAGPRFPGACWSFLLWIYSGWADLNRRPLGPEPSALTTALQPVGKHGAKQKPPTGGCTGATGFEPAISGLTGRRDNQTSLRPQDTAGTSLPDRPSGAPARDSANVCMRPRTCQGDRRGNFRLWSRRTNRPRPPSRDAVAGGAARRRG